MAEITTEAAAAVEPKPRALLIDLDNCPGELVEIADELESYCRIVGCYAGPEPRVPLGLVLSLAKVFEAGRFELVSMKVGKNAADFGLAFWAGRLFETLPDEIEIIVLSKDKDLDRVVELLRKYGRSARRVGPRKTTAPSPKQSPEEIAYELMGMLQPSGPNPASKTTLLKRIRTLLKQKNLTLGPEQVLEILLEHRLITLDGKEKVSYHFERFEKLSDSPPRA